MYRSFTPLLLIAATAFNQASTGRLVLRQLTPALGGSSRSGEVEEYQILIVPPLG